MIHQKKNKTILATAYAVNPYKGSEDGMGWNFICQIARFHKIIAITRKNNQAAIEKYMGENHKEYYKNIHFLYFDLPYWLRFWKKGSRGALLYYLMWQKGIVFFVKKQQLHFDIVHNLSFHNDWTPSYLWKLNKPFVWGPIGHHPRIPRQYLKPYKKSYWIKDRLIWLLKKTFWNLSLSLNRTIKKADFICCMNSAVPKMLNLKNKKYAIMPSVASENFNYNYKSNHKKFTLISVGRLVPLKGFDLSILAFASFLTTLDENEKKNCELLIIGSGPERDYYKKLCRENNIQEYVLFIAWMDRKKLMDIVKKSSVFLFPSHEGAGMVVSEALSFGLPVVCLKNSGPGEFIDASCGFAIPVESYSDTVKNLGIAITKLYNSVELRERMSKNSRLRFENRFDWDVRGESLRAIYLQL